MIHPGLMSFRFTAYVGRKKSREGVKTGKGEGRREEGKLNTGLQGESNLGRREGFRVQSRREGEKKGGTWKKGEVQGACDGGRKIRKYIEMERDQERDRRRDV